TTGCGVPHGLLVRPVLARAFAGVARSSATGPALAGAVGGTVCGGVVGPLLGRITEHGVEDPLTESAVLVRVVVLSGARVARGHRVCSSVLGLRVALGSTAPVAPGSSSRRACRPAAAASVCAVLSV